MLILSRYIGEKVIINDNIIIQVLDIKICNNSSKYIAKLGFDAPKDISIHRDELYKKLLINDSKNNFNQDKDISWNKIISSCVR